MQHCDFRCVFSSLLLNLFKLRAQNRKANQRRKKTKKKNNESTVKVFIENLAWNERPKHTLRGQCCVVCCHPLPLSTREKLKLSWTVSVRRRPSPKNEITQNTVGRAHTHTHSPIHPQLVSFVLSHSPLFLYWHELVRKRKRSVVEWQRRRCAVSYNETTQWYWWAQNATQYNRISLYARRARS